MSTSQEYLSRVDAQRQQVRRAREHLDHADADFHAAAEAWEAAGHPEDGELLYAYKRAAVWLSHVAATHQGLSRVKTGCWHACSYATRVSVRAVKSASHARESMRAVACSPAR